MEWIGTILAILTGGIVTSLVYMLTHRKKKKSQYQKLDEKMNKDKEKYDNMSDEEKVELGNKWFEKRKEDK